MEKIFTVSTSELPRLKILHTECSQGAGGQVLRVVREAALLAARGHQLAIVCHPDSALSRLAKERGLKVFHIDFPSRGFFGFGLLFSLVRLMKEFRPDAVMTHSSVDSWAGGIAARWARIPLVIRTRHIHSPVRPGLLNRLLYGKIADAVITTGDRVGDMLADELGLPRNRFISIPTGVDLTQFSTHGERAQIRAEWGLDEKQPAIGIIAALRGMKNHKLFLHAAAKINECWPQARFFVVGDGPPRQSLEQQARELKIDDIVHFTGHRDDIPDIMAALDMVVLCSSRGEGVPQVISQAMAMNKPVIATDVGSVRELVENEVTGLLVEPENIDAFAGAIVRLLKNPALAAKLTQTGRRLIQRYYSEEKMADAVEELLAARLAEKQRNK